MGLQINTNITALDALRNLTNVTSAIGSSIQKLSSGLQINQAADNPSGLIISNGLQAQVDGINQAISNSQDATNLIKTADGALSEVNSLLDNIRQLSVHAANTGVNDQLATQADQSQISSDISSVERIATQTQFGNKNLLDGSAGISASVVNTNDISGVYFGGTYNNYSTQGGNVSITVNNPATRAQIVGTVTYASINASLSTANGTNIGAGGSIVINGQTVNVTGSNSVQSLINDVNNISSTTGVSAQFTFGNGSGSVALIQQNYGGNFSINEHETSGMLAGTAGTNSVGLNATVTVSAFALVNGVSTTVISTFIGGRSSTDSGMNVTDAYGNSILLSEGGNTTATASVNVASISAGSLQFQIGANAGQYVTASLGNIRTSNLGNTVFAGQNLSTIDVTSGQGATNAITIAEQAIQQVSTLRANLGAFQANTLQATVNYLGVSVENLSASESQIRDTNVAAEVVNLTKNQIIQQAATAMLAQANLAPQQVLKLLG